LAILRWLLLGLLVCSWLDGYLLRQPPGVSKPILIAFLVYTVLSTLYAYTSIATRLGRFLGYITVPHDLGFLTLIIVSNHSWHIFLIPAYLVFQAIITARYGLRRGLVVMTLMSLLVAAALMLQSPAGSSWAAASRALAGATLPGVASANLPSGLMMIPLLFATTLAVGLLPLQSERARTRRMESRLRQLATIQGVIQQLYQAATPENLYQETIRVAREVLHAEAAGFLLLSSDENPAEARDSYQATLFSMIGQRQNTDSLTLAWKPGRGAWIEVLREQKPLIASRPADLQMPDLPPSLPHPITFLGVPVVGWQRLWGELFVLNRYDHGRPFNAEDQALLVNLASQIGLATETAQMMATARQNYFNVVKSLVTTIEAKHPVTRGHSERVIDYAVAIAREMGLPPHTVEEIRIGALLHDIGKIGIPESILDKAGDLSEEEWEIMRRHPHLGFKIVDPIDPKGEIMYMIYFHHERYDGNGYPNGLSGDKIPLGAAIIHTADAFETMTATNRSYRRPLTLEQAMGEIRRCSGTDFNPAVADALLRVLEREKMGKGRR